MITVRMLETVIKKYSTIPINTLWKVVKLHDDDVDVHEGSIVKISEETHRGYLRCYIPNKPDNVFNMYYNTELEQIIEGKKHETTTYIGTGTTIEWPGQPVHLSRDQGSNPGLSHFPGD